jgi:hypothetical protein
VIPDVQSQLLENPGYTSSERPVKLKRKTRRLKDRSGRPSTDNVNSGSGPDYQIYIPLGCVPW